MTRSASSLQRLGLLTIVMAAVALGSPLTAFADTTVSFAREPALHIQGDGEHSDLTVSMARIGTRYRYTVTGGGIYPSGAPASLRAATGCAQPSPSVVRCWSANRSPHVRVELRGGNDRITFQLDALTPAIVSGGEGDDVLVGGRGDDIFSGGPGLDELTGGYGSDDLRGNAGDDWIDGAGDATSDDVSCGDGHDRVLADRTDVIRHDGLCEGVKFPPTSWCRSSPPDQMVRCRLEG